MKTSQNISDMDNTIRKAYVAGKFYPETRQESENLINKIKLKEQEKIKYSLADHEIIGAVLPHAGHIFSGYQTIHFFEIFARRNQKCETFILLHPVHRGGDYEFASDNSDFWTGPLGKSKVDNEFIDTMGLSRSDDFLKWEHSAEVFLPFIQYYEQENLMIVPVGFSWQKPESAKKVAEMILNAENILNRKICVIASSDFSHFLTPEQGKEKDQIVLDRILNMDTEGVYSEIRKHNISVCGYGPIMALMYYSKLKYPKAKAEVLSRGHSGDVYPSDEVVDYISVLFYS